MIRKHIYVTGRVQGVGFRFFAQQNAAAFHLSGYVQNLDNGMVELEIQGEPEDVEKFLLAVSRGTTWIQPVSYTHLDVYKRQGYGRACI